MASASDHDHRNVMFSERTQGDNTTGSVKENLMVAKSFVDHFTLPVASSIVRFRSRNNAARVFESNNSQVILEEQYDPAIEESVITVKKMSTSTRNLQALRALYTTVAILWSGILFAFCLQVLLFLVLDMAVQSGQTSITKDFNMGVLIGVMLCIIVFIDGFAAAMVLTSTFCSELWSGHSFMKKLIFFANNNYNDVVVEWIFFVFFLGIPVTVLCITLMSAIEDWWTVTSLVWFGCITVMFFVFSMLAVYYEVTAALTFVRKSNGANSDALFDVIKQGIIWRQIHAYSGREMDTYLAQSFLKDSEDSDDIHKASIIESTRDKAKANWWAQLTKMGFFSTDTPGGLKLFEPLDPPKRLFRIDDVQDYRPFLTKSTWGLERIFCRPANSRYIAIIDGPGALTRSQIKSNIACSLLGTLLILWLCIAVLVWLDTELPLIIVATIVLALAAWKVLKRTRQLSKVAKDYIQARTGIKDKDKNGDDPDHDNEGNGAQLKSIDIVLNEGSRGDGRDDIEAAANQDDPEMAESQADQRFGGPSHQESRMDPEDTKEYSSAREFLEEDQTEAKPKKEQAAGVTFARETTPQVDPAVSFIAEDGMRQTSGPYSAPRGDSKRKWDKLGSKPSEGIYLVSHYNRVTKVTERMAWILFALEHIFYFIYPFATLIYLRNWAIAGLFVFVALNSSLRHYMNVAVAIEERGNMDLVDGDTAEERWANTSRLSNLVKKITHDKSRIVWSRLLWGFGLIFVGIFLLSIGTSSESTNDLQHTYLNDFYYPPQPDDMRYPTCSLPEINEVFGTNSTIGDYIFLAGLAYNKLDLVQDELDGWFPNKGVKLDTTMVSEYRERTNNVDSAANFKLFTVPESNLAIVSIRGTQNAFDLLADSQLWSAAMLVQVLRGILPLGEIWTPILDELVLLMNGVESSAVGDVSFYRIITPFVEELKESGKFDHVQVTGHSLGGGLSIITGAQAKVPAVAISGPNARISGLSFDPPVRPESLDRYTFNIIPDRDLVPRFDDVANNFQNIRCNADFNDFIGCHDFTRALCEIAYTCGSANRPVVCACHQKYDYPMPSPLPGTTRTIDDACPPLEE